MTTCGITLLLAGVAAFFITRRKYAWFLFFAGLGAGILIGMTWSDFLASFPIPTP